MKASRNSSSAWLSSSGVLAITLLLPLAAMAHVEGKHAAHSKVKAAPEQQLWGIAGESKAVKRTITLRMGDNMRFTPDTVSVNLGDTIRFVVKNDGKLMHELVIGTKTALQEHAALMVKFPTMEHDAPYMAHISPGKTGEIIWTFNRAGDFDFACLIAGHYQSGMVGKITVATNAKSN